MKLLYCTKCNDVVALREDFRTCVCGESGGKYFEDGLHAETKGSAIPLGFANSSFWEALQSPRPGPMGVRFEAFVIPENCPTVKESRKKGKENTQ